MKQASSISFSFLASVSESRFCVGRGSPSSVRGGADCGCFSAARPLV